MSDFDILHGCGVAQHRRRTPGRALEWDGMDGTGRPQSRKRLRRYAIGDLVYVYRLMQWCRQFEPLRWRHSNASRELSVTGEHQTGGLSAPGSTSQYRSPRRTQLNAYASVLRQGSGWPQAPGGRYISTYILSKMKLTRLSETPAKPLASHRSNLPTVRVPRSRPSRRTSRVPSLNLATLERCSAHERKHGVIARPRMRPARSIHRLRMLRMLWI